MTDDPDEATFRRVAYHEAGHAIVGHLLGLPPAKRIFISSQGGGVEVSRPRIQTLETAKNEITTLLAGRAAEKLIFGYSSNGAGGDKTSDLALSTELALNISTRWGLGIDTPVYQPIGHEQWHRMPKRVRKDVVRYLETGTQKASEILSGNVEALERIANALLEHRELDGYDLRRLITDSAKTSINRRALE
ncbi:MAG: hypothetical protein AB8B58_07345 [Roseobacter sp.]